jgi:hypothetical protein
MYANGFIVAYYTQQRYDTAHSSQPSQQRTSSRDPTRSGTSASHEEWHIRIPRGVAHPHPTHERAKEGQRL